MSAQHRPQHPPVERRLAELLLQEADPDRDKLDRVPARDRATLLVHLMLRAVTHPRRPAAGRR